MSSNSKSPLTFTIAHVFGIKKVRSTGTGMDTDTSMDTSVIDNTYEC